MIELLWSPHTQKKIEKRKESNWILQSQFILQQQQLIMMMNFHFPLIIMKALNFVCYSIPFVAIMTIIIISCKVLIKKRKVPILNIFDWHLMMMVNGINFFIDLQKEKTWFLWLVVDVVVILTFLVFVLFQAYELSTLTGTQVMLLVASETGHVYTFATRKLQPMITSDAGKALIQTCLNSPDTGGAVNTSSNNHHHQIPDVITTNGHISSAALNRKLLAPYY